MLHTEAYLSDAAENFGIALRLKPSDELYVDVLPRAFVVRDPNSGKP